MSGNYYSIDIWGLLIALVMVAVAAGISEAMRMGIGKTLLWSACRALLQLCAMGFIMEFVIKSNNPWLVLLLVMFMLIAAVQITLSRAMGVSKGLAGPVFLSFVITMLIMISLVTELIIRPATVVCAAIGGTVDRHAAWQYRVRFGGWIEPVLRKHEGTP